MNLIKEIRIDWKTNSFSSAIIIMFYRIKHYLYNNKKNFLLFLITFLEKIVFLFLQIDSQISYKARIGSNLRLLHRGQGVVISSKAIIGNNCTILHQVTIGINETKKETSIEIGNHVFLGAGAKIISCKICDGCKIGANATIVKDIVKKSIVYSLNEIKEINDNGRV